MTIIHRYAGARAQRRDCSISKSPIIAKCGVFNGELTAAAQANGAVSLGIALGQSQTPDRKIAAVYIKYAKLLIPADGMAAAFNRDRPPDWRQRLGQRNILGNRDDIMAGPAGQKPTAVFVFADLM